MLEWSSPLWLLGLSGAPFVWLLHRLRSARPEIPVSAGFLWRARAMEDEAGRRFTETDPAWRRRALLVALLALAAAGPRWAEAPRRNLDIWVDDSLSLQAMEGGTPRHRLALAALAEALRAEAPYQATLRSLGRADRSLRFDSGSAADGLAQLAGWFGEPGSEPRPPIPAAMNPEAAHWLLTDGADAALDAWAAAAPLARIVRAGEARENLAVTVLSVRPVPDGGERWAGLVGLANTGALPARRTVELHAGGRLLRSWPVELAAGASTRLSFDLPEAAGASLRAWVSPADALEADDRLALDLSGRIPARRVGPCGPYLRAALEAHPRLDFRPEATPELTFACGEKARFEGAGIHFHSPGAASPPAAPLFWTAAAGPLRALFLDRAWLRIFRDYPFRPEEGETLLAVATRPLIRQWSAPDRIAVYLDMDDADFARRPEYPALVAGLVGRLAPAADWERGYEVERSPEPSRIAPLALPPVRAASTAATTPAGLDLGPWLILAALAVLALDLARGSRLPLARQWGWR